MVLLTADRPPQWRGWGANQTIDQTRMFGPFVREFHDPGLPDGSPAGLRAMRALGLRAGSVSRAPRPGPVQINLPFDEPLVPSGDCLTAAPPATPRAATERSEALHIRDWPSGRGLILIGPGGLAPAAALALWHCAARFALPVLTDPLSGLRFGAAPRHRVTGYDALLRNAAAARALRPDWVLRLGRAPVSRLLGEWIAGIPAILVDPTTGWCDPSHDASHRLVVDPAAFFHALARGELIEADAHWLERWRDAERHVQRIAKAHLANAPWCEGHIVRTLVARLPAGESLFCANSLPIRQLDTWSGTREAPLVVYGNRGASGIDGQMSTLAGLNHGGRRTWGLLGDLSFCHDLSGLLLANRLDRPVLVLNNGGGRIFDYLPQQGLPDLERLWRTPVAPDLGALARPFGLAHRLIEDAAGLDLALVEATATDSPRGMLLEIRIDAERSRAVHQAFWTRVSAARIVDDANPDGGPAGPS